MLKRAGKAQKSQMENQNIGFIGAGKMGSALIQGIIKAGVIKPENMGASDVYEPFLR